MRATLRHAIGAVALWGGLAMAAPASAQDYPTRPVTIVVPSAPGGTTDISARLLADGLSHVFGQQFVVENKGGASGNLGIGAVARAQPDGQTLLLTYSGYQVTNPSLFPKLTWDPVRDFIPIALVIKAPHVVLVRKELPANSIGELIGLAKQKPGVITFASSGPGSIQHIGGEMFQQMTDTKLVHVPYRGAGPAMNDLIGGSIDLFITTPPSAAGHIKAGAVKALAVAAPERSQMLPDVPTTREAGLPGFELVAWFALYAPARTPQPIIDKLAAAAKTVVASPEFQRRAAEQGASAVYLGPAELATFQAEELKHWGEVIRSANIRVE